MAVVVVGIRLLNIKVLRAILQTVESRVSNVYNDSSYSIEVVIVI